MDTLDTLDIPDTLGTRDTAETLDTMDTWDTANTLDSMFTWDTPDTADTQDTPDTPDTADTQDTQDTPDTADTQDTRDTRDTPDTADSLDAADTLDLARLDRECQGPWEAEYSYWEEADLHRHYDNCTKNPGHKNFIPVDKFSIDDLPERYRDNDIVDYIRAVSDLTVRVTVKYVSDRRPESVGVSDKPYLNYQYRGQRRTSVGTGWVETVTICNGEIGETCRCYDCRKSSTPQTKFAIIYINTATHVVYDESEGEHTTCHLFFDRGGAPETCKGVVALTGMRCLENRKVICNMSDTLKVSDICNMYHYTHDLDLAERLEKRWKQRKDMRSNIIDTLQEPTIFKRRQPTLDKQPLLFIVSHPHGCSKQISIGHWTSSRQHTNHWDIFTYTTATCPGSSGASIFIPKSTLAVGTLTYFSQFPIHSGVLDNNVGINFSNIYTGPLKYSHRSSPLLEEGPWEEKFACVEEEDLHKLYNTCQKNPGHKDFFPVDRFSMDNLPPFYRKIEIMQMIKCVAGLTVRVSVKYVSEGRPETVAGTDIPYPWHTYRGSNQLRVGSGCVIKIESFNDDVCECEECQSSDTPKIGYAHVYVETATHLVYDELEGKHTTCHLFYDSGETLDACKGVVTLRHMCHMNNNDDTCKLMYKTHDLDLADTLKDFKLDYDNFFLLWRYSKDQKNRAQDGSYNRTLPPPLDIVVSHPHGLAKHISIGYYGSHGNTDTENSQCLYNSIICPGSSGAPVITLGKKSVYPSIE